MEDLLNLNFSFNSIVHFQRVPPKYVAYKKEDLRKLLEIAKRHDNIYLEILLCLFCGLRIGEVRGLNFDHVDFENHTITVMQQAPYESFITIKTEHGVEKCLNEDCIKPPKSGSSYRTIKVPDIVVDELYRRREKNKQYFKTHPNAVSYWRNYICIGFGGELISSKTVTEGLKYRTGSIGKEKDYITREGIFRYMWMNTELTVEHKNFIYDHYPAVWELHCCIKEFRNIFKKRNVPLLYLFIEKYCKSKIKALKSFAEGLKRDIDAVENAVVYDYSNGFVEGTNSRLKMIKRTMYGRCRKRLLEAKLRYVRKCKNG